MNIDLKLEIPVTGHSAIKVKLTPLLYPFYCTEYDIVAEETKEVNINSIRKLIHEKSIIALNETKKLEELNIISEEELLTLRRDYTICLTTYDYLKASTANYITSLSRSKSLGNFSVSTSHKSSTDSLKLSLEDNKKCIQKFHDLIIELTDSRLPVACSFVKGSKNVSSHTSNRLWAEFDMFPNLNDAYASTKYTFIQGRYKAANYNLYKEYYVPRSRTEY